MFEGFFSFLYHSSLGGSSRVVAMPSSDDRSRSPVSVPSDESGKDKSLEVETGKLEVTEGGNQVVPETKLVQVLLM